VVLHACLVYWRCDPPSPLVVHAGLAAAAVALVAVAAKGLIAKTAKDRLTSFILLTSAALSFVFQASWLFPVLIIGGGFATLVYNTWIHKDMALPVRCNTRLSL
jgi:chromate transport protein ChrA